MTNLGDSTLWVGEQLRADLTEARRRYELAKKRFDIAVEDARNRGLNQPDGSHSLLNVSRDYHYCLAEYRKALDQFCEFTLHGKIPQNDPLSRGL